METDSVDTAKQIHVSSPFRLVNGQKTPTPPNCTYNPATIGKSTPNSFHGNKFFKNVFNTPPSRLSKVVHPKVVNPFEVGLTERLHLPLICSPSLFHRPNTPQMSSTHFEWTIDEISSLNPASFEAHETQFASTTDPETEAKIQVTLSSFFRDQIIVPSPVDCPLRNQKIILSDEPKTVRDGICQTELSLPPNLPKDIEDLLKPYFTQTMNQQQSPAKDCDTTIDHDARDALLRRKLFNQSSSSSSSSVYDDHIDLDLECLSPPPCSPELRSKCVDEHGVTSEMPESDKPFCPLSPINIVTPIKIQTPSRNDWSCESMKSVYNSTPECSLSNYLTTSSHSVSILNDTKENNIAMDMDLTMFSMTDDEKQLTYMRTPSRRRHRYSSRKNLSHSFSCLDDDVDEDVKPIPDGNVLCKTDSGFNETDDKANDEFNKWPAKQSVAIPSISDTMDVDAGSPSG
ncbi:protein aurora borealis [Bradysia coprophila]|uniref:protein aurora borealis n=1 Tax=Bradysia coprophila TaxID=38358 RepID=UPI00187D9C9D|nr:protein aurora borealis [Bradysia coprophila]